jgi:hypothetical protein
LKISPLFPLAKLGPLALFTGIAVISGGYVVTSDELVNYWVAASILPLAVYLGFSHFRARKRLLAENGREREIIQADLAEIAAHRTARFWTTIFAVLAITTCTLALCAWSYQLWLWYREDRWIAVTWHAVAQNVAQFENVYLQRLYYWLGDTNLGAAIMIVGLLTAVPLVAINHRSLQKAKRRQKELGSLKRRS